VGKDWLERGTDPILIVRLGAMGDILHALPSLSSLRASFPHSSISWVVAPKWKALLEGNPAIDRLLAFRRSGLSDVLSSWRMLRPLSPRVAIDFQGLLQSALVGRLSRPGVFFGWDASHARERWASMFYSKRVCPHSRHVVDQNLELAAAAGARTIVRDSFIPPGQPEGTLPSRPFVLTHPFAGWTAKQWPLEHYGTLATLLAPHGIALVANVPPQRTAALAGIPGVLVHTSSLGGLIDATRRAAAVVGLDSGPMHLAAALNKPGVALFGPTDPARNGPYSGSMVVLRSPDAVTSYRRRDEIDPSMRRISPSQVYEALLLQLQQEVLENCR
jgi:heptosyltransferase-1